MIFEYTVKHNGIRYPAGTDVPVGNEEPKKEEIKVEPKVEVKEEPKPQAKIKTAKRTTKKK